MEIRKRLPLTIILLIITPLMLLAVISYKNFSKALTKSSIDTIDKVTDIASKQLEDLIVAQKLETKNIADRERVKSVFTENNNEINMRHVTYIFKNAKSLSKDIIDTVLFDKNGVVIINSNKENNNELQSFIKSNKEMLKKDMVITDTNLTGKVRKNSYIISQPVKDRKGNVYGCIANIYNYNSMYNVIKDAKVGESSHITLVHKNGQILGSTNDKKDTLMKNGDITNIKGIEHKIKEIKKNDSEVIGYRAIKDNGLVLILGQSLSEINRPARKIMIIIFILMIIFTLLGMFLAVGCSRVITDPISDLMNTMELATVDNFNIMSTYKGNNEIGRLSSSFNSMIKKLKDSYEELTRVYGKLSVTEEELRAKYIQLKENERNLKVMEEKYRFAVDGSNDAIWEYNINNGDMFFSSKWKEIVLKEIVFAETFPVILEQIVFKEDLKAAIENYNQCINNDGISFNQEFRSKEKKDRWILIRGTIQKDEKGNPIKISGTATDITYRKRDEERIKFLAYYDTLTNIPNRAYFLDNIDKILSDTIKAKGQGAMLFIGLDNFKKINDNLGHSVGDILLKKISKSLKTIVRNKGTVCRYGGDEFLIILNSIMNKEDVKIFSQEILDTLNGKFLVGNRYIYFSVSVGVALFPADGLKGTILLKNADTAMHRAKELGKNRCEFYDVLMSIELKRKSTIEHMLREALKNNGFIIHYQPKVHFKTGEIHGFEALLRLKDNEEGMISPKEFIPIAEETGLIIPMGYWVISEICKQNKLWRDKGLSYEKISVNISPKQLEHKRFLSNVRDIINNSGVDPKDLDFEITENILVEEKEIKISILKEIQNMGISISLDDFGTGYCSLNYLKTFPVNTIKIDKSFIDDICIDKIKEYIIDGVIVVAKNMNLDIVVEGVETKDQYEILKKKSCDLVQGYLFSKPIPNYVAEEYLYNGIYIAE